MNPVHKVTSEGWLFIHFKCLKLYETNFFSDSLSLATVLKRNLGLFSSPSEPSWHYGPQRVFHFSEPLSTAGGSFINLLVLKLCSVDGYFEAKFSLFSPFKSKLWFICAGVNIWSHSGVDQNNCTETLWRRWSLYGSKWTPERYLWYEHYLTNLNYL